MFEWIFILLWCSHYSMSFLSERWFSNFSRKTVTNQLVINSSVWVCVFVLSLRICPPELRICPQFVYLSWVGVSVLNRRICLRWDGCIQWLFEMGWLHSVTTVFEMGWLHSVTIWDDMAAFSDYLRWDSYLHLAGYLS